MVNAVTAIHLIHYIKMSYQLLAPVLQRVGTRIECRPLVTSSGQNVVRTQMVIERNISANHNIDAQHHISPCQYSFC